MAISSAVITPQAGHPRVLEPPLSMKIRSTCHHDGWAQGLVPKDSIHGSYYGRNLILNHHQPWNKRNWVYRTNWKPKPIKLVTSWIFLYFHAVVRSIPYQQNPSQVNSWVWSLNDTDCCFRRSQDVARCNSTDDQIMKEATPGPGGLPPKNSNYQVGVLHHYLRYFFHKIKFSATWQVDVARYYEPLLIILRQGAA